MSIKHLLFAAGLATVAVAACAHPSPFEYCTPEPGLDQEETVCQQNYHPDVTAEGSATVIPDPEADPDGLGSGSGGGDAVVTPDPEDE